MSKGPSKYVNRELSWLEFNQRVLDEATDEQSPLLERLKFLAITASNLDEFFMVRVGGLQMVRDQNSRKRDAAGLTVVQQLKAIRRRARQMVDDQYDCLLKQLEPELSKAGIRRVPPDELNERQQAVVQRLFEEEIFTIYTPMAIQAGEQFPLLANMALNVCVRLAPAVDETEARFAFIPLGNTSPRFFRLPPNDGYRYILLEDVVRSFADRFFPGEKVLEVVPFRITRNADLSVREDLASDLLSEMEHVLDARKESDCVRLELPKTASRPMRRFLCSALEVASSDVYLARGPLALSSFMRLANTPGFDRLKVDPWRPQPSPDVDLTCSMFDVVRGQNVMLSLPYESFDSVVRLVKDAAEDSEVLAIKIILYRTSRNSPIVEALRRASEMGQEPGARRGPSDLWRKGAEDSRQGLHHHPPRDPRNSAVRTLCHRELQRRHGQAVQRHQLSDLRRRPGGRRHQLLQRDRRLLTATAVPQAGSRSVRPAPQSDRFDRRRDQTQEARPASPHHGATQFAGLSKGHRFTVQGVAGRREDRLERTGHLLSETERTGLER